jgi:diguanylate cyclase (GGDEF)-like protein
VHEHWAVAAPDGLTGGPGLVATHSVMTRGRSRSRDALSRNILAHLKLAVAALDADARLLFWNEHAAHLFGAPSSMAESMPGLAAILTGATGLTQPQRDQIVTFARTHIAAGDRTEANDCLRLSLGQASRITIQVHGMGAGRWMLVLDDGRFTTSAGAAAEGAGDAWLDTLTGVSNRRHFNRMLWEAVDDAAVAASHAVLLIDLDRFAPVNEGFGNAVGDALLCLVAKRLRREIRDVDLLARLGGDEFAVLIPNGSSAEALAARVITVLGRPFAVEGQRVSISASVGIVSFPEPGVLADDLLCHVELALYEAKLAGGSTWRRFDAARAKELQSRRELETALQKALALGEFSLVYQACGKAAGAQPSGFEARLQWDHPVRGALTEQDVLPQAEDTCRTAALDDWKLHTACATAAQWPEPLIVATRVAARQLCEGDRLLASVKAALGDSGLPASRLQLHIAETTLQNAQAGSLYCLHRLRALGVHLALVDAIIGPAAMNLLHSFPFHAAALGIDPGSGVPADGGDPGLYRTLIETGCRQVIFYLDDPIISASGITDVLRRHGFAGQPISAAE